MAGRITTPPRRGHVVVACVEGEWHALAARIVAEVVRDAGWRVTFLGASVPGRHLVTYLHQTGPDAVLLSCVQSNRLIRAARMVEACRAAGVPVLAGGPGFGWDGRWAAAVGAAAWGATARDAVRLLARGLPGAAHTGPTPAPPDDGYVAVLHRRRRSSRSRSGSWTRPRRPRRTSPPGWVTWSTRWPRPSGWTTGSCLLDFVGWQAEALASRGGRRPVDAMLAAAERTLIEHPRAVEDLRAARAALTTD